MFGWIKNISDKIRRMNFSVDKYKSDSIIQSLPVVAYVNKAKKLMEEYKITEAQELLLKASELYKEDSLVYKYLGIINERNKDFKKAIEYYQKSADINPNDKEIWLKLGMCLLYSENFKKALEAFEKADKVTPYNTDVYTGWGMTLMRMKKYAFARDKFVEACKISKYNYTAILLSAVMEIRMQDYNSAEDKLSFLSKVAPNESTMYEYSRLKLIKSDYGEALSLAKKAIEYNKQMLPAYLIMGEIYSIKKDREKMNEIFNKAIFNDLDNTILHFEWGKCYIRLLDYEEASQEFSKSLNFDEDNINAKMGLALVNAYKGNFDLLEELREKNADNVYIIESIGLKYMQEGKYEDAIDTFKKALKKDPQQTYNYYNLAEAYKVIKNPVKVKDNFDKFIELNEKYLQGYIAYSKWLIDNKDYTSAQRKLRRAQKLAPDNAIILNMLFITEYTLAKNNICEYNVKEALTLAHKIETIGEFEYPSEKAELEEILNRIKE